MTRTFWGVKTPLGDAGGVHVVWNWVEYHDDGKRYTRAFLTKREACAFAASFVGFSTYGEAHRKGWVRVERLS